MKDALLNPTSPLIPSQKELVRGDKRKKSGQIKIYRKCTERRRRRKKEKLKMKAKVSRGKKFSGGKHRL